MPNAGWRGGREGLQLKGGTEGREGGRGKEGGREGREEAREENRDSCTSSPSHMLSHTPLSPSHTHTPRTRPLKRPAVSTSWLTALLSSIPHLPKDVIKGEILNIAVANGQLSQTVSSRQASCQIIGRMAPKFEPFW